MQGCVEFINSSRVLPSYPSIAILQYTLDPGDEDLSQRGALAATGGGGGWWRWWAVVGCRGRRLCRIAIVHADLMAHLEYRKRTVSQVRRGWVGPRTSWPMLAPPAIARKKKRPLAVPARLKAARLGFDGVLPSIFRERIFYEDGLLLLRIHALLGTGLLLSKKRVDAMMAGGRRSLSSCSRRLPCRFLLSITALRRWISLLAAAPRSRNKSSCSAARKKMQQRWLVRRRKPTPTSASARLDAANDVTPGRVTAAVNTSRFNFTLSDDAKQDALHLLAH